MKKGNLVIWGYFTENLGDDLMLKAFLNAVKGKYNNIYINSFKQYKPLYSSFGVKVISLNAFVFKVLNKFLWLINRPELYYRILSKKNTDFVMLGGSLFIEAQSAENARRFRNLEYAVNHAKTPMLSAVILGLITPMTFFIAVKTCSKNVAAFVFATNIHTICLKI